MIAGASGITGALSCSSATGGTGLLDFFFPHAGAMAKAAANIMDLRILSPRF